MGNTINSAVTDFVTEVLQRAAPLYEGENVLREWLRQNGIVYMHDSQAGVYYLQDWREGYEGKNLPVQFFTYGTMLEYALEHCKNHIIATAVTTRETEGNHVYPK